MASVDAGEQNFHGIKVCGYKTVTALCCNTKVAEKTTWPMLLLPPQLTGVR